MNFKNYVEDSIGPGDFPAKPEDPEMNGLSRPQTMTVPPKPSINDKKKKKGRGEKLDKWDKIFMGESIGEHTAGILFTTGDNILLLKRSSDCGNPFTWGLPGGHAQDGETPLETATREAKEEIGKVAGSKFGEQKEGNWTCFFYKVAEPFECKLNNEHTDFEWIPFHKLKKYKLHPKFKKVAAKYIEFIEKFRKE